MSLSLPVVVHQNTQHIDKNELPPSPLAPNQHEQVIKDSNP